MPFLVASLLALAVLLFGVFASAQSCTVASSPVAFGAYDPFSGSALQTTGRVDVACTDQTPYTVKLDVGVYGGGTFATRKLKHLTIGSWLLYNLYRDAGRSEVWGDGTGGTYTVSGTGAGLGTPNQHTVYGRLPALQNGHVGQYTDTITVTVTY